MSLICAEVDRDIEFGYELYAATRDDMQTFSALSKEALGKIPDIRKRAKRCGDDEDDGLDIHIATSSRNFNDSYTLCDFDLGEFSYSISRKTAEKYLPNFCKKFSLDRKQNG